MLRTKMDFQFHPNLSSPLKFSGHLKKMRFQTFPNLIGLRKVWHLGKKTGFQLHPILFRPIWILRVLKKRFSSFIQIFPAPRDSSGTLKNCVSRPFQTLSGSEASCVLGKKWAFSRSQTYSDPFGFYAFRKKWVRGPFLTLRGPFKFSTSSQNCLPNFAFSVRRRQPIGQIFAVFAVLRFLYLEKFGGDRHDRLEH